MNKIIQQIYEISAGVFKADDIQKFIHQFAVLCANPNGINSYFLQISRDEGSELEIGFLTQENIFDITLSNGKVYSCTYPVSEIQKTTVVDSEFKTTLQIQGRKKFDYNVLKPESIDLLMGYKMKIDELLKNRD